MSVLQVLGYLLVVVAILLMIAIYRLKQEEYAEYKKEYKKAEELHKQEWSRIRREMGINDE